MPKSGNFIEIFLQPGEYYVGDMECRIRTLLGSCVSVTLWHPVRRIGAMSHFLLPSRGGSAGNELDGRYGDEAMLLLSRELRRSDVEPTQCTAKVFGGGNMFPRQARTEARNVGRKNGEVARLLLQSLGIPIVSESLFGTGHRQVIFDVASGHVWSRQVKPVEAESATAAHST